MEDLEHIGVDKLEYIVELYGELRERFREGEMYNPHLENKAFAEEQLGFNPEVEGFGDIVESCDLFLANVHSLFIIKNGESSANWDSSVGVFHDFLNRDDDEWLRPTLEKINEWISNISLDVEIPY